MVRICTDPYEITETNVISYIEQFPFPLSDFQKYAVEGIVTGNDVLITAHTGSGKTLPAEFAIRYFTSLGKKVIYTAPIKALSNQKFKEFSEKFPNVGILTGDIKMNPEADVLIMTTEILQKQLYDKTFANFDLDKLACVIFDEVHYINDADRGTVWEETIMNLPPDVQLTMLSATIDSPIQFATWCESKYKTGAEKSEKEVWLIPTYTRIVPLIHYGFVTATSTIFKTIKDKSEQAEIKKKINTFHLIKDKDCDFHESNYRTLTKFTHLLRSKNIRIYSKHVMNELAKKLVEENMLPALCFVLSRRQLEVCAHDLATVLIEDDSKVPYIIERECENIIRRLPNSHEYLRLPEFHRMVKLLEKGIGIHHAGVLPVFREMVEILYATGYIKMLFATETFAVGVNMPTKTTIFTNVMKFDGNTERVLHSHEYTQMSGRAGRRGIDTVGYSILLYNLFPETDHDTHRKMLQGSPPVLYSKLNISYPFLINLIQKKTSISSFLRRSMYHAENIRKRDADGKYLKILDSKKKSSNVILLPRYNYLKNGIQSSGNKKRKQFEREMEEFLEQYPDFEQNYQEALYQHELEKEMEDLSHRIDNFEDCLKVDDLIRILNEKSFILEDTLCRRGVVSSLLNEINPILFSLVLVEGKLETFTPSEIIGLFACFLDIRVADEFSSNEIENKKIKGIISFMEEEWHYFERQDMLQKRNQMVNFVYSFDMVSFMMEWFECSDETSCKLVIQRLENEKEIFLGDFIKGILKLVNIGREVEKAAEYLEDMILLEKLQVIPQMLKFVATAQSLYV